MRNNVNLLSKAEALMPRLYETEIRLSPEHQPLNQGDELVLDFGEHLTGYLSLELDFRGSHPDAPLLLDIQLAEKETELLENPEEYHGWISASWVQREQVHVDQFPCRLKLPRRYAFRYLRLRAAAMSSKYRVLVKEASVRAVSSANRNHLLPYRSEDLELLRIDRTAVATLHDCMQLVFEDGPKRDRRLWMGDLRIQALANYQTFQNYDLVKRCLYLFAGSTGEDGRVSAAMFMEPEIEADDTFMFDYSLFFIPTLRDYFEASGDRAALEELWPVCQKQLELSLSYLNAEGIVEDKDQLGWCFVDWNLALNKQASAQGIYLYCLQAALDIASHLGDEERTRSLRKELREKRKAARNVLFDESLGMFVSGRDRQISWASQIWMVLGGAAGAEVLRAVEQYPGAEKMITPYLYHSYVQALIDLGEKEKALQVIRDYWGGMVKAGADTFWELYDPQDPNASPYGGTIVNSFCHAWSCGPAWFLRKYYSSR